LRAGTAAELQSSEHPIPPFHWEVEFPEVFSRANRGFDAFIGNPPFAGKNTVNVGQGQQKSNDRLITTLEENIHSA